MCGPTTIPKPTQAAPKAWFGEGILLPLHPSLAVAGMAYFLPTGAYLNRGFTVWFHLISILQVLTQSKFLAKVIALTGASVCLGWYAAILADYTMYDRWCHALYKNMPQVLVDLMVPDATTGVLDFESTHSLLTMGFCHVLDFIGHPLLAYYFWKKSKTYSVNQTTISLEWSVILVSWSFSRCWSLVHTYHNFGKPNLYYFGFDVYVIDDLALWYPAYILETLFYASVVLYKITQSTKSSQDTTKRVIG